MPRKAARARSRHTFTPPTTYEGRQRIAEHNLANAIKGPMLPPIEPGPYGFDLCFKYSERLVKTRRMKRTMHSRAKLCFDADTANDLVDAFGGGIAYECLSGLGHWHYTPEAITDRDRAAQERRDETNTSKWIEQFR